MASPPPKRLIVADDIPGAPEWLEKFSAPINAFIKATAGALDRGVTFGQQFAGEVKTVTLTPPDDWYSLTSSDMRNSWQLYPSNASPNASYTLAVRKELDGTVEVRGLANPPTTTATGVAFAWPDGYAPHQEEIFGLRGELQSVEARAKSTGADVTARGPFATGTPSQGWVSFSGMRFMAANRTPPRWAAPIDVRLGTPDRPFPGRPAHVLVLNCQQVQAPTAPSMVRALDWTATTVEKTTPAVRIHRVWGLLPGVAYSLTLGIFPG